MPGPEPSGLWQTIKAGARRLASFQAGVLLKAVYYVALGPAALLARVMGEDPLGLRRGVTGWVKREPIDAAEHLRGQG
jgi:hypothetical protein